jgi:hypothetical protein
MRHALCLLTIAFLLGFATPARADLQVNQRVDKVVLKDGTEIQCIVLMVTSKNVLIVEADDKDKEKKRQRIIPFEDVDHIDYGKSDGSTTGLETDAELAHKVIQGTGFRKEDTKKEKEKKEKDDKEKKKTPTGNQPLDTSKIKNIAPEKLASSTGKLSAKDLSDAYMSRFPVLKGTAQTLIGLDRVPQLIDAAQKGDPLARKQVEGFLSLFLGADTSSLAEKPDGNTTAPQKPVKPSKPSKAPPVKKAAPTDGKPAAAPAK